MSTKTYACPYCNAPLTHGEARKHWERECPNKPKGKMKKP